jgi:hypothetical protein
MLRMTKNELKRCYGVRFYGVNPHLFLYLQTFSRKTRREVKIHTDSLLSHMQFRNKDKDRSDQREGVRFYLVEFGER